MDAALGKRNPEEVAGVVRCGVGLFHSSVERNGFTKRVHPPHTRIQTYSQDRGIGLLHSSVEKSGFTKRVHPPHTRIHRTGAEHTHTHD